MKNIPPTPLTALSGCRQKSASRATPRWINPIIYPFFCLLAGFSSCPETENFGASLQGSPNGGRIQEPTSQNIPDQPSPYATPTPSVGQYPRIEATGEHQTGEPSTELQMREIWEDIRLLDEWEFVPSNYNPAAVALYGKGLAYVSYDSGKKWNDVDLGKWSQYPVTEIYKETFGDRSLCVRVGRSRSPDREISPYPFLLSDSIILCTLSGGESWEAVGIVSAVMRPIDHQSSSTDASLFTHPIAPNRLFARATLPRKVYDKISGQVHVVAPSIFAAFSDDFGKTWSPRPMLDTGGDQVDFRDLEKIVFSVSSDAKNGSFLECNPDLECTLETRDIDEDATQHEMRKDAYLFQHVNAITLGEVSLTITGGKMCRRTTGSTQEEIVWTYASEVET